MKKTVVEYITDTLEDIPKQSLQTNKRRLHAFFSEQETIEKRGTHFVFRYAFYSFISFVKLAALCRKESYQQNVLVD